MAILTSLRRAFTVSYLLVAFLPVLLFGLLSIQLFSDHQLKDIQQQNKLQTRNIAEEVDAFLNEVKADLFHVKHVIDTDSILQAGSVNQFLSGVVANSQFFESIYYLDNDRTVLHLGLMPHLETRQEDYNNLDFSEHQLFEMLTPDHHYAWSNTFVSLITGEPSVTLGVKAANGFLFGNINLNSLGRFLQRYIHNENAEIAIIDNNGTLIAHSISEKAEQRINFGNHPVVLKAMAGEGSTSEYRLDSVYYLESAVDIDVANWVVWVGLDMNAVNAPINNLRNILIGFMVATAILASAISLFNIRRLMLPLTALGDRAGLIAEGHYEFQFRPSGFSEIDALASQITTMTKAIKVREESIIANENRFRDLVNSIDGIVWEMDYPSFRFLFVSQQADAILGYPAKDWYEDPSFWEHKVYEEDRESAKAYCQLMSEKQEDHDFEYRMIASDGRVLWIRDLVTVVVENNRPTRLLGVMIDVTEQKVLLDELRRSEENYREIFNSTSDAIFIHDANTGQVLDVNQAMMSMFNCSYEQALEAGLDSLSHGESPYSLSEALDKIKEAKDTGDCTFEWRSKKQTGELFWTEVYLRSAILGNQPRILAAVRDITQRKEAEARIYDINERLTLLIARMPIGCIYWTPEFTVNLWNPTAEEIFGFEEQEMLGKGPYGTIVQEELRAVIDDVWQRLLTGDQSAHSVNENLTRDGRVITCEWFNTPVKSTDGQTIGVVSMVQDISERKATEDELAQYRSSLESLVEQRTEQLEVAQRQLVQKERLAVLGQLTATVSHEIRNPLGTVANALYFLKNSLEISKHANLQRSLQLAERNVERCDGIISDLLDFSRQRKVVKEKVDIDTWLNELFEELKIPDDIQLITNFAVKGFVPIDAERMRRVIVNLANNAFQAMDETDRTDKALTVMTRVENGRCFIEFQDNGNGMNEEVLNRIFEPMFSTKNFGVGLGVPIIKSIIENHGGGVEYRSIEGEGTTVLMWVPLDGESVA